MHGRLKVLGLTLFALVSMLAVSASAAHADWVLLEGAGKSKVGSLSLTASTPNPGQLLVVGLGLEIECQKGSGTASITDAATPTAKAKITFTECKDNNFGEVCTVRGVADAVGSITGQGEGTASMTSKSSTDLFITAASKAETPFADVLYEGEECPLTEIDGEVTGSVKIEVKNPTTHTASHNVEVVGQALNFGEEEAELHDGKEPPANVTGTVTRAGNVAVSVVLLGL